MLIISLSYQKLFTYLYSKDKNLEDIKLFKIEA